MIIIIIIALFLLLLVAGMPVNFALGFTGTVWLFLYGGGINGLDPVAMIAWSSTNSFTLTAIPLFILMGEVIQRVGFSRDLYDATTAWFGKLPGGLAIATVFASGIFAAVSGSSAAGCATIGLMAIPEMERHSYKRRLIYGTMTAGGSLSILIPPSVILIIYATFTSQSVGKLFLAGFIPGFILSLMFIMAVILWAFLDSKAAPKTAIKLTLKQKILSLRKIWIFVVLMVACLGTIYIGVATPTEAAGLGAFGSLFLALVMKRLTWQILKESLLGTVEVTCMVLFLLLGGLILSHVLLSKNVPAVVIEFTSSLGLPDWGILIALYGLYAISGCLLDGITLMIISLPIVAPLIASINMSLLWFGIAIVLLVEVSQITPPVGMNLYIIRNISGGKIEDVIMGSLPFLVPIVITLIIITLFPSLVLYLPKLIMP